MNFTICDRHVYWYLIDASCICLERVHSLLQSIIVPQPERVRGTYKVGRRPSVSRLVTKICPDRCSAPNFWSLYLFKW